jgi:hypothetical protein
MNIYTWHVTIRRIEPTHAIQRTLVEVSVRTQAPIKAMEAVESVQHAWRPCWRVVGVERGL